MYFGYIPGHILPADTQPPLYHPLAGKVVKDLKEDLIYPHENMCIMQHKQHAEALEAIQAAHKDPAQKEAVDQIYKTVR